VPLFKVDKEGRVEQIVVSPSPKEKKGVQPICEKNLQSLFHIRFVATEHPRGQKHAGRIDTLGPDENDNPVIIEYKRTQDENIVTQGLYYLDWLLDHKGDFEIAAQKVLGKTVKVTWSNPRLILIAQSFSKFDTHAVSRTGQNVELKTYRFYQGDLFYFEDIFTPQEVSETPEKKTKLLKEEHELSEHLANKPAEVQKLFLELRDLILALGPESKVQENVVQQYVAYKTNRNFCEINVQKKGLKVFVDVPKEKIKDDKSMIEDYSKRGRPGTGESAFTVSPGEGTDYPMNIIKQSYDLTL